MDDDAQMRREGVRLELAPGVTPPAGPPGPPPPWMASRPAGVRAFIRAFEAADLHLDALRAFDRPVWYALGGLSHPDLYAPMRDRLATVFPDFSSEVYAERHHFDPPHRVEPLASRRRCGRSGPAPTRSLEGHVDSASPSVSGSDAPPAELVPSRRTRAP